MKWWDNVLAGIGICVAAFAIWSAFQQYRMESFVEGLCDNKIQSEIVSPDGRQKVIVFTHDCGAAGYPHTIVTVLRKSGRIPKHQPIEQRLAAAAWEGYDNVTIRWRGGRIILVEERGGGEEESSAPNFERLKVETDGRGGILKVSPTDPNETSQ